MDDSVKGTDNLSTPLQPKHTAVKRNMVVLGLSPLFVRIKAMVGSPALVFVLQPLLRGSVPLTVDLHNPLCPEVQVCVNKDLPAICRVPEAVIRAAAHDDTGPLPGKLCNDLILDCPQIIFVGGAIDAVGEDIGKHAAGGIFSGFPNVALTESALLGDCLDDLCVIAGNPQFLRYRFPNGASAAAEFPADGDYSVFYKLFPPLVSSR